MFADDESSVPVDILDIFDRTLLLRGQTLMIPVVRHASFLIGQKLAGRIAPGLASKLSSLALQIKATNQQTPCCQCRQLPALVQQHCCEVFEIGVLEVTCSMCRFTLGQVLDESLT